MHRKLPGTHRRQCPQKPYSRRSQRIGIVETGVVGLLTIVYGVAPNDALAITLVDRAISVLSIIALGSVAYAISGKRRGAGVAAVPV